MSNSLSVVIDADIARSSGISEHPTSSGSRALLENVSTNGHRAAICPTLMQEWKKHQSLFAKKWLSSMIAKKKVDFIKPEKKTSILINKNIKDNTKKSVAEKDAHLLDAALIMDNIVTSNDNNARSVFCSLSNSCGNLKSIKWFNAVTDKSFVSKYFSQKTNVPKKYYLG